MFMGKDINSLIKSRMERITFKQKFGCVPSSILKADKSERAIDHEANIRSYGNTHRYDLGLVGTAELKRTFSRSGSGVCAGALSRFPKNLCRLLTLFYCPEKGTFFDPFAGHNSRMQTCFECERDYVGNDLSHDFMVHNRNIRKQLIEHSDHTLFKNKTKIILLEGDSSHVNYPSDSCHFTLTSPPYWNLEYYGDEPDQLGNRSYPEFLKKLFQCASENFRILKSGSFCIWNVNDFVKDGIFYPYHIDCYNVLKDVGFVPHAIYILDFGSTMGIMFLKTIVNSMRFPKQHEYFLVFRKE